MLCNVRKTCFMSHVYTLHLLAHLYTSVAFIAAADGLYTNTHTQRHQTSQITLQRLRCPWAGHKWKWQLITAWCARRLQPSSTMCLLMLLPFVSFLPSFSHPLFSLLQYYELNAAITEPMIMMITEGRCSSYFSNMLTKKKALCVWPRTFPYTTSIIWPCPAEIKE